MKTVKTGSKMKSAALVALIALNALLAAVLVNRHTPENRAVAAGPVHAADILAVPGNLPGFSNGVVFLIDPSSGLLTAISYDAPTQKLSSMTPIDLAKQLNGPGPVRGR